MRERRKRTLETERLFARQGNRLLTDVGILIESHPENALDDARTARATHKVVEKLFDAPAEAAIEGADGAAVLGLAATHAVDLAAGQAGEEGDAGDANLLADSLQERLPGVPEDVFLEDLDYTAGWLRELVGWLAVEAGGKPDANTVDGSVIGPE